MSGPYMNQSMNTITQNISQGQFMDPHVNDQPLSFNSNKGKPPMPIEGGSTDRRNSKPDEGPGPVMPGMSNMPNMPMGAPIPPPMGDNIGPSTMGPGEGMMMPGGPGFFGSPMGNMSYGPMIGPNPDMMNQMMMFGQQMGSWGPPMGPEGGPMPDIMPQKEIITLKSCVMYPPPPTAAPPTTRERPPGCRTIFVGGLPETCSEEILQELFDNFGPISSVRKSKKKNFAHIRFESEDCVDRSLFLSGYRMKIEDKDDKPNTGRIHVDFAMARDDQYEYECKSRAMMRDMRHRYRIEEERLRPPSPPPIIQYSDYEASVMLERLKTDEDFLKASQTLLTWLERGDVSRRNISNFYGMIQCTNSHIRRLLQEKQTQEAEVAKMKEKFNQIFEGILKQFDQIERIFTTAQKQKNWDHFTKAQRRNIELWLKQAREIKQNQQDEFLSARQEDEMEMSDEDEAGGPANKKKKVEYSNDLTLQYAEMAGKLNQLTMLQEENDTQRCQIEAYKNELELLKHDNQNSTDDKDKQFKSLQLALQGMQQQLIQARGQVSDMKQNGEDQERRFEKEKDQLLKELKDLREKEKKTDSQADGVKEKAEEEDNKDTGENEVSTPKETSVDPDNVPAVTSSISQLDVSGKEAKLLGLICVFLHVHPTGASVDYILSYLSRLDVHCTSYELGSLLDKFSMVFTQTVSGVGARMERRWHYMGCRASFLV